MIQKVIGDPVWIRVDTLAVILRISSQFVKILFWADSLDDIVVFGSDDFTPEADLGAFVIGSDGLDDLSKVDVIGLA